MSTFKEFAHDLIQEMPYFHYTDDYNHNNDFDLEIEKRTFDELSSLLIHALSGETVEGDSIKTHPMQLRSTEEKMQLINTLLDSKGPMMLTILSKYGSQISPRIRDIRIPVEKRTPDEIDAYGHWVSDLLRKSKILSK